MKRYATNADMLKDIIKLYKDNNSNIDDKIKGYLENYTNLFSSKNPVPENVIDVLKYLFDEYETIHLSNKDIGFLLLNDNGRYIRRTNDGKVYLTNMVAEREIKPELFTGLKPDKDYLISDLLLVAKYTGQL